MRCQIEPYRQGDLDGLCGLYVIVNAFAALCPELDNDVCEDLFRALVQALPKAVPSPLAVVYRGMGGGDLRRLLMAAQSHVAKTVDISIEVRELPRFRTAPALGEVWARLRAELKADQVAILGLTGGHDHWTLAVSATERALKLLDSGDRTLLLRSRCTLQ